jgi:hypothetical protein
MTILSTKTLAVLALGVMMLAAASANARPRASGLNNGHSNGWGTGAYIGNANGQGTDAHALRIVGIELPVAK